MNYSAKDYSKLIGMQGFSETLLKNHFTLYQGYVTNTNKLLDSLEALLKEGKTATPEYAEMKRRLGWEFNGMRLHELYFENLGGKIVSKPVDKLASIMAESFGGNICRASRPGNRCSPSPPHRPFFLLSSPCAPALINP